MGLSVRVNLTLPHLRVVSRKGVVESRRERQESSKLLTDLKVVPNRTEPNVLTLSGGNQQKVLFGKWLFRQPKVLIADEPTRGVTSGQRSGSTSCSCPLPGAGWASS